MSTCVQRVKIDHYRNITKLFQPPDIKGLKYISTEKLCYSSQIPH